MKGFIRISLLLVLALLLVPMMAQATPINVGFQRITNNNADNLGGQLGLVIYDQADTLSTYAITINADQVLFAFTNNVGISSNVSEIYIDDNSGTIAGLYIVRNSIGGFTKFVGSDVNPSNLPGGETVIPDFVADEFLSADTASGPPKNGINDPLDILGIVFDVSGEITDIQDAIADGSLRIGLHVRSIGEKGESDSYINTTPTTAVPEPSTLMLLGTGLIGIGLYRWRRKKG